MTVTFFLIWDTLRYDCMNRHNLNHIYSMRWCDFINQNGLVCAWSLYCWLFIINSIGPNQTIDIVLNIFIGNSDFLLISCAKNVCVIGQFRKRYCSLFRWVIIKWLGQHHTKWQFMRRCVFINVTCRSLILQFVCRRPFSRLYYHLNGINCQLEKTVNANSKANN